MSSLSQPFTSIKTRAHRKRRVAECLIKAHQVNTILPQSTSTSRPTPNASPIRIVCISDTHNKQPTVPLGDVLIHAGDLTENGSFEEMQNGLKWLSSQPHRYKIFVAGNHDVLLDDAFLAKYPQRRYGQSHTKQDLDWGSVVYLQDSAITLEIPPGKQSQQSCADEAGNGQASMRSLTIFGSPWTPRYGVSAFQYDPNDSEHWQDIFASLDQKPHIIVTHGPPRLHLDRRDFHRAGCPYLAEEVYRLRPRLHIFGHIHASYGREDAVLDRVQRGYAEVMTGWASWGTLVWMTVMFAWARVKYAFGGQGEDRTTTFINAALVEGPHNELRNAPIVIDM